MPEFHFLKHQNNFCFVLILRAREKDLIHWFAPPNAYNGQSLGIAGKQDSTQDSCMGDRDPVT